MGTTLISKTETRQRARWNHISNCHCKRSSQFVMLILNYLWFHHSNYTIRIN